MNKASIGWIVFLFAAVGAALIGVGTANAGAPYGYPLLALGVVGVVVSHRGLR